MNEIKQFCKDCIVIFYALCNLFFYSLKETKNGNKR